MAHHPARARILRLIVSTIRSPRFRSREFIRWTARPAASAVVAQQGQPIWLLTLRNSPWCS